MRNPGHREVRAARELVQRGKRRVDQRTQVHGVARRLGVARVEGGRGEKAPTGFVHRGFAFLVAEFALALTEVLSTFQYKSFSFVRR